MTAARDPEFYLAHAGYVRALARRLVYDPHAADDLFQAAWLAALERPPVDASAPRRWLAALVRNLAVKSWLANARRRAREQQSAPPPSGTSPADVLAHESERQRVVAALLELEEPYRATLIQRFFDGLEPAQIAARDGVPVETVRTRCKRGLQRLRERLQQRGGLGGAFVAGLRLGPPSAPTAMAWTLRGVLLMSTAKKVTLALAVVLAAALGLRWSMPQGGPDTAAPAPTRTPAAAPGEVAAVAPPPDRVEALSPTAALRAASGQLAVHVLWADQSAAAGIGARIGRIDAANFEASVVEARTDRDGAFSVSLPPGEVLVDLDRGVRKSAAIRAGERTELALTIPAGVEIRGRVRDCDGRAAVDAEIYMVHGGGTDYAGQVVAHSAEDGSFAIHDAPPQTTVGVSARAPGRAPSKQQLVTARAGAVVDVELAFTAAGGALVGTIVDAERRPVASAVVVCGHEDYFMGARAGAGEFMAVRARRTGSDAHGEYRIDGLAAGDQPVVVVAKGFATWRGDVRIAAADATRCEVQLQAGVHLQGIVRAEGGIAIAGASVRVGRFGITAMLTAAAADGSYALDGLPLDDFQVAAAAEGRGEAHATLRGSSGEVLHWDPVLSRDTTLRGRVEAPGRPLAGFRIDGRGMPGAQVQWFRDCVTDKDGRFELTNCPPALLHLEVRSPTSGQFAVAAADDVDPLAGEVVLTIDAGREPTAHLAGRVVDECGQPIAGAELMLLPLSIEFGGGHFASTDADGRFKSPGCPAGDWRLMVSADGFAKYSSPARALAAGAPLDWGDIALSRGGSITVNVTAEAGIEVAEVAVSLQDSFCGLANDKPVDGVVTFRAVTAGSYRLVAYGSDVALAPRAVAVRDQAVTEIGLRLVRGSEVRVEIQDDRGQGIQDRIEAELVAGDGASIDAGPIIPTNGPLLWIRRLVAGSYQLRLRDHLGRTAVVPIALTTAAPLQLTATLH